ncbi:hypothetical protein ACXYRP_00010 [Mycoplasma sp. 5912]
MERFMIINKGKLTIENIKKRAKYLRDYPTDQWLKDIGQWEEVDRIMKMLAKM